jgi:DNA repair protein RadC
MRPATCIREASIRYRGNARGVEHPIREPANVAAFVRRVIDGDAREHFVTIMLDARHRPVAFQVVSVGTATASLVHPREVFQSAVHVGACALIVAHNHPSGDTSPSPEDRGVAKRLADAGKVLGIALLDSVVVTEDGHHSMREEGGELWE